MWNGFWKLTAMVGVVGVGLFAAYQAQKGMDFKAANALMSSFSNNATSDEVTVPPEEDAQKVDSFSDEPTEPTDDINLDSAPRTQQRKLAKESEEESFSDSTPKPLPAKKALASNSSNAKALPGKWNDGVNSQENDEISENASGKRNREPNQLLEDDPPANTGRRQPIQQVNQQLDDSFADDAPANPKTDAKSFSEEPAQSKEREELSSTEDSSKIKSTGAPGKAQISSDFDSDPPPIVSKRAKQKSAKKIEEPIEEGPNPFDDNSTKLPSQPPAEPTTESTENFQPSDTSATTEKSIDSKPTSTRAVAPLSAPQSLPSDAPSYLGNEMPSTGTRTPRNRPAIPAQLPDNSSSDPLLDSSSRKREPVSRRADFDRVTPVDMVGDGVVGDISQRGLQQPRLTIEKVAAQQAVLGQPLIYSIIVKNTGTVDAHNVVIEDRIPKGTELVGTSPQAELSGAESSGKRLIWNHLVLKPNEEKKISIKVIPIQEGPIGSVARVYFATEVSAEIVVAAPQLDFTVKAPHEVRIGQRFDLIFNLKNVGKVDANNIIVRDIVPDELKNDAGADIECPVGKLAPNEAREIVLSVTAARTGSVTNKATLTADSGIKKSADCIIEVVGEILELTRTGQNRLYVERPAAFTNNVRNDGNKLADRVKIVEIVPAGMEFESATEGGKYDPNLRAVVWTVGPLAPGNDKSVTVKYVPKELGTLAAKITATGSAGSTAAVNSSVDVYGKPELQMETLSATGVVTIGERITSKFQLNNTGTAAATNVQLRVRLPRELRLISVKGAKFRHEEDEVIFEPIAELAPRTKSAYELILEPVAEADAQIELEISADHLIKPGRRTEMIQIARDELK